MDAVDVEKIFQEIDATWIQRQRCVNTKTVVWSTHKEATLRRGTEHVLRLHNVKLSAAALCKAKQKIPLGSFQRAICQAHHQKRTDRRVLAVDGSKIHLPVSFLRKGFTTRTNNKDVVRPATRPLAMLNSIVDTKTRACLDFTLTQHFNERLAF